MVKQSGPRPAGIEDKRALDRVLLFSDAVFAVAITLLALDIRLPPVTGEMTEPELQRALVRIWPQYFAYVLSFLTVGLFWLGHHRKFRQIRRYDGVLLRINLLLLMVIAFVPFATRLLSEFHYGTSVRFYAATMMTAALLAAATSAWASHRGRLTSPEDDGERVSPLDSLSLAVVFAASILISYRSTELAMLSWILIFPLSRLVMLVGRRVTGRRRG
jgi:TMEM175 potassium channel family protein